MTRFDQVRQILEDGVGDVVIGAHGNFWRTATLDEFVAKKVFGQKLLVVGNPDDSNLIKALEGRAPFGSDTGTEGATFRRMPAGKLPVPADQIAFLKQWIADGCPDDALPAPIPVEPPATPLTPPDETTDGPAMPPQSDVPGLMAVDPVQRDIDWLRKALQVAVELELSTIPPYLCAAWSIKDSSDPVSQLIRGIVQEEMLHMGLACNMLNAIGVTPKINSPHAVPTYPGPLPGRVREGLIVGLSGLTPDAILTFMEIETPQFPPVAAALLDDDLGQSFATIGDFYDAIRDAFRALPTAEITGERQVTAEFPSVAVAPPEPTKQRTLAERLIPITTLQDVENAISEIKEQGEGTSQSPEFMIFGEELAHYYRFGEIYHGRVFERSQDGTWGYTGAAVPFPETWPVTSIPEGGYPDVSATFDAKYTALLDALQSTWETGDSDILGGAIGLMFGLEMDAVALMQTPLPNGNGNYGPSFLLRRPAVES